MGKQLVSILAGQSLHVTFVDPQSSLAALLSLILAEDGSQITRAVCGNEAEQLNLDDWRVQAVRSAAGEVERTEERREELNDDGALSPSPRPGAG